MEPLRTHLDFESRSLCDLLKLGEHAYARHWSTAPLMVTIGTAPKGVVPEFELIDFFEVPGYAAAQYPNTPDPAWQIFKVPCPPDILRAVERGDTFVAHNARFEQALYWYICHRKWGWPLPVRWSCTAARSRYFGIRASLAGSASDLEVISQKDERGKQFINDFCKPRKYKGPKKDGIVKELWYEPHENPQGYQIGKEYCIIDGKAEADIDAILPDLPPFEQAAWEWDFNINIRGVPLDIPSVERAIQFSDHYTAKAYARFEEATALRPTQRDRVLEYLQQREEIDSIGDLRNKTLKRLVTSDFPVDLQEVIQIRLDCSLASTKKLATMIRCADDDGRVRGIHLYGGAHTMRWSAKRVQTQNMKRGSAKVQAGLFDFLAHPSWELPRLGHNGGPAMGLLDALPDAPWINEAGFRFTRPLASLSQSMRGFIAAPKGKKLVAGDFSQIEAKVLAWLARATAKLEAYAAKKDQYVKFATKLYSREYEAYFDDNGKVHSHLGFERQVSKSAELGCGFGLGGRTFVAYCDNMDITIDEEFAKQVVGTWREDNPEIVALWSRMEQAAILATVREGETFTLAGTGTSFKVWRIDAERYWLVMGFPSGRAMHYYRPKVDLRQKWGRTKETLSFRTEWNGKSYREDTYGGKLTENAVQGIARDVMVVGGLKAEARGYPMVMLVHDELVALVPEDFGSHQELCNIMCEREEWYTDLPLSADGATMMRYGK
jgi:DNA polymerase bacteriophage-type